MNLPNGEPTTMAKKETTVKGTTRNGRVSMSDRLRAAYEQLIAEGWDINTVSTADIVSLARKLIKGRGSKDAKANFNPTPAQVSIVKREYTGGSPTGGRGRPSHESIGLVEAA